MYTIKMKRMTYPSKKKSQLPNCPPQSRRNWSQYLEREIRNETKTIWSTYDRKHEQWFGCLTARRGFARDRPPFHAPASSFEKQTGSGNPHKTGPDPKGIFRVGCSLS